MVHFKEGFKALEFFNSSDKTKILFLSDFELINQELNGLEVIEKSEIKRSILVTSYHSDPVVIDLCKKQNIYLLPKQCVFAVPVSVKNRK